MIDSLLTVGTGQRIGILLEVVLVKSTLMGMIAKQTEADLKCDCPCWRAWPGSSWFIEKDFSAEGLKRSIVVVATSDQPALTRMKAAYTATAIAEYFRDEEKCHVP
ncbi:hypothetical protein ACEQPO_13055 [Bacillus sp. SL00103]